MSKRLERLCLRLWNLGLLPWGQNPLFGVCFVVVVIVVVNLIFVAVHIGFSKESSIKVYLTLPNPNWHGEGGTILLYRKITISQGPNIRPVWWSIRKRPKRSNFPVKSWPSGKVREHLFPNSKINIFNNIWQFSTSFSKKFCWILAIYIHIQAHVKTEFAKSITKIYFMGNDDCPPMLNSFENV